MGILIEFFLYCYCLASCPQDQMEVVCSQEEHNRGDTIDVDFTLYQGYILSNLALIVDVNHYHQTKGLFVELLHPVSLSPFPLLWKEASMIQLSKQASFPWSIYINYFILFFNTDICLLPITLIIQTFIYIAVDSWRFIFYIYL